MLSFSGSAYAAEETKLAQLSITGLSEELKAALKSISQLISPHVMRQRLKSVTTSVRLK